MGYEDFHAKFPKLVPADFYFEVNDGWLELIETMCQKLYALDTPGKIVLTQVKSKFSLLRVYFDCQDMELYQKAQDIISDFEIQSSKLCCICGATGEIVGKHYWANEATCSLHRGEC